MAVRSDCALSLIKSTDFDQKGITLNITRAVLRKGVAASILPCMLILILALAPTAYAQTAAPEENGTKIAALIESSADADAGRVAASAPDPQSPLDLAKELAAMKARIEVLEMELKSRTLPTEASLTPVIPQKLRLHRRQWQQLTKRRRPSPESPHSQPRLPSRIGPGSTAMLALKMRFGIPSSSPPKSVLTLTTFWI